MTSPQYLSGGWIAVRAGDSHAVAIRDDGTVWSWGLNDKGQLGTGDYASRATPAREVSGEATWTEIAAGSKHTVAFRAQGVPSA